MNSPCKPLAELFRTSFDTRSEDGFRHFQGVHPLYLGFETRKASDDYRWDGLRRGESPRHPKIVFQCCLDGWGVFEKSGRVWRVEPGHAFVTVMPSRHVYHLPRDSEGWSFYYFTLAHPRIVERLSAVIREHPPVFPVPVEARLHSTSLELFERTLHGRHEDEFAEEQGLYEWMFAFERHLRDLAHPRGPRESLLEAVRRHTLANLRRSFGVEELARAQGMSRSHFSHHFREVTGLSPAAYIMEQRLVELSRLLRETDAPLKDLAAETGFADANHLCKVFRRHFHVSPGVFRRSAR